MLLPLGIACGLGAGYELPAQEEAPSLAAQVARPPVEPFRRPPASPTRRADCACALARSRLRLLSGGAAFSRDPAPPRAAASKPVWRPRHGAWGRGGSVGRSLGAGGAR